MQNFTPDCQWNVLKKKEKEENHCLPSTAKPPALKKKKKVHFYLLTCWFLWSVSLLPVKEIRPFFLLANNLMLACFHIYQVCKRMSSQLPAIIYWNDCIDIWACHPLSPRVESEGYCFISDIYLTYCKSKDFFKVSRLTYKEQIEGPASTKVSHNDCINWHWSEKSFPGSTKFLGEKRRKTVGRKFLQYQDYPLYCIKFTLQIAYNVSLN